MLGQLVLQEVKRLEDQGVIGDKVCDCAFCDGKCIDEGARDGKQMVRCMDCGNYQYKGQPIESMD